MLSSAIVSEMHLIRLQQQVTNNSIPISIEIDHTQFGGDVYAAFKTARNRAELRMEPVYPFRRFPLLGSHS